MSAISPAKRIPSITIPDMKFSYTWLKELAGFMDTPEQLAAFLTMRAFEVEGVEKTGTDWVLDISGKTIGPRMADASGHRGLAREIAALKNTRIRNQESGIREDKKRNIKDILDVHIENPDDCSRYTARVMDGITVGPSPAWIRERLDACGIQPISNVVDAANYVMLETGQPLHVFDMQKLKSENEKIKNIVVRRARNDERITGLDDKTYELNTEMLVIADEKDAVAIAGIKGGKDSGVSQDTTRIVLESASFDPLRIRAASRVLGLRTDASARFERGMDPNETAAAVDRLAALIQEIAGGAVLSGTADHYPRRAKPRAILFRPAYAERMIGVKIPASFYRSAFRRLGWTAKSKGKGFAVMPPTVRRDIEIEEDIVEEIARLYDYANVPPQMPAAALHAAPPTDEMFWEDIARDALTAAGFCESELYEFASAEELALFGIDSAAAPELENPPNPQTQYLTPMIAIRHIISAGENLRHHDAVRIFGIQKEFRSDENGGISETKKLVIVSGTKEKSAEHFYAMKGVVDIVLQRMGIRDMMYTEESPHAFAHPHRAAAIMHDGDKIGAVRELHPSLAEKLKVRGQIVFAALPFAKLAARASAEVTYRPASKYPAVTRDIAVVVPDMTRADDVLAVIKNAGGQLLADTDLFDYFQDDALREKEIKSMAFHLMFQSDERTLTDADADAAMQRITAALESKGWDVKK